MDLLNAQQQWFEEIKTLCSNYKKDGSSRKSETYLNEKLKTLEEKWMYFADGHSQVLSTIPDKNINYFNDEIFEKTSKMCQTTVADIKKRLRSYDERKLFNTVSFDTTGIQEIEFEDENLEKFLSNQAANFKALERALYKVNISDSNEKWELEDHLNILKARWEAIDKLHWIIDQRIEGTNDNYSSAYITLEQKYDDMRRVINSKIHSTVHFQSSVPKLQIPEFSGDYKTWVSFKDLFQETIHNNPTISKAQKMQHLKAKLRGDAERIIQHLTISAENYETCWQLLTNRYDNKHLQFVSYMNNMMSLPTIQTVDAFTLKRMHDKINEAMNGISNTGIETSTWDPIIVFLMAQKLDSATYEDYLKSLADQRELHQLHDFLHFIEGRFLALEAKKNTNYQQKKEQTTQKTTNFSTNRETPMKKYNFDFKNKAKSYHAMYGNCPNCNGPHTLMRCPKFLKLNIDQRNRLVAQLRVCKNCLYSHGDSKCTSTKTCTECTLKHHTLLHHNFFNKKSTYGEPMTSSNAPNNAGQQPATSKQALCTNHLTCNDVEILLTTFQLQIKSADQTYVTLRGLLDQGSQVNMITENAAQLLRLPRTKLYASVSGIGTKTGDCKGSLQLICKSLHSDYAFETEALIISKIMNNLPNTTFDKAQLPHLSNLKLADPEFNISQHVDILLGADIYAQILLDGVLRGPSSAPIAQQTRIGWILCGKLSTLNCHVTLIDVTELSKFWDCEEIMPTSEDIPKDDQCEIFYNETFKRAPDGKYVVELPLKENYADKLGNSRNAAVSQFLQLERRFERAPKLAAMYKDFVKEYQDLGHMQLSTKKTTNAIRYYLPHHGIIKENSTTTKLRTVFNASQKTTSGYSLNDLLEKGPNLQKDIQALILKWRMYKYAYTADIEKMYRCSWISEKQRSLQTIVWRNSPNEPLKDYELCTITYGTKSAPWLAMRTLKQLAIDDAHRYPEAAEVLKNDFFVDDLVSGSDSLEQAKYLQTSLIALLKGGGMNLRKWTGNHPALLENLTQEQLATSNNFNFKNEECTKTLGISWNPISDTFYFDWNIKEKSKIGLTKRSLLSQISQLYDPLGWLSPITVTAKLIFQKVWKSTHEWDKSLPYDIQNEWKKLKSELNIINNYKLKRWVGSAKQQVELFGFCDASEKAYACVIYARTFSERDEPTITLLAARTRVAPLAQKITLPRMELCGAVLLSELVRKILLTLNDPTITTRLWCDSQVVLAWLKGDSSKWETYITNRVSKIKTITSTDKWEYVKSEENPADCASRGLYPSKLENFTLWWQGPDFLKTIGKYPTNPKCLITQYNQHFILDLLNNQSSLTRITRIVAWIRRFVTNCKTKVSSKKIWHTFLTSIELHDSSNCIIKCVQKIHFNEEIKLLKKKESVSKSSSIYKLNPYIDEQGLVRVGGRLNRSTIPLGIKNPVIISQKGRFTQLLIEKAHQTTLHGGARLTLTYIRQQHWIVSGNRTVKAYLRKCVRCQRYNSREHSQLMGELPPQRITPSRPFTHTGVDFTGHVDVKANKGRGIKTTKGYIAIFVCMVTKAIHIELVSDLSTETFIAALQRLCARRGVPKYIYSDCGTNFKGASRLLQAEFEEFRQILTPDFFNEVHKMEIEWKFNPPAYPNAGGLWESGVKSMKHHLHRVLGDQKLTFEEFYTLLTRIEACLNSRPLCPLTEDPEEFYNSLTPGHFLTGSATLSLPVSDYSDAKCIDFRRRWQLMEHMMQSFWKNWSNEYLHQLQTRSKWNVPTKNIKEGDIVLVRENNLPPGKWAMGRVTDVHPGSDGYVRVVTLKTATGILQRPVVKLSPLPVENNIICEKTTEPGNVNKNEPKRKNCKKQGRSLSTLLTTILLMFTCLPTALHGRVIDPSSLTQITNIEPDRPIYYDTIGNLQMIHDECKLIMYYNLSNYWEGFKHISTYITDINSLCNKTDPKYCKATMKQLQHELDILEHNNQILLQPHTHLNNRKKRGALDFVGYAANGLFGILDQRFADKYQNDIESVQNNEKYLLELLKNQTYLVELQNTVLKKTEANIKQQADILNNFMMQTKSSFYAVEKEMEIAMATSYFSSASLSAYMVMNNIKDIQEMLINTLTDVFKGHLDVHLLTPSFLKHQLMDMSGRLPKTLSIPISDINNGVKDIYKFLYLKARATESFFIFELHIPLISNDEFQLYRAIPLPIKKKNDNVMVQTSAPFIAINYKKKTYISLTEETIKQ